MVKIHCIHDVAYCYVGFIIVMTVTLGLASPTTTSEITLNMDSNYTTRQESLGDQAWSWLTIIIIFGIVLFALSGVMLTITVCCRFKSRKERDARWSIEHGNTDNDVNQALAETITNDVIDRVNSQFNDNDATIEFTYSLATRQSTQSTVSTLRPDSNAAVGLYHEEASRLSMIECDPPLRNSDWNWTQSAVCRIEPQYLRTLNVQLADIKRPLENYVTEAAYLTETHTSWKHCRIRKLIARTSKHISFVLDRSVQINCLANESVITTTHVTFQTIQPDSHVSVKIIDEDSMIVGTSARKSPESRKSAKLFKTKQRRSQKSSSPAGNNNLTKPHDDTNIDFADSDIISTIQLTLSSFKSKVFATIAVLDTLPAPSSFESSSVLTDRYRSLVELIREKCANISALLSIADEDIRTLLSIQSG